MTEAQWLEVAELTKERDALRAKVEAGKALVREFDLYLGSSEFRHKLFEALDAAKKAGLDPVPHETDADAAARAFGEEQPALQPLRYSERMAWPQRDE